MVRLGVEEPDAQVGTHDASVVVGEGLALVGVELGGQAPAAQGLLEGLVEGLGVGPQVIGRIGNEPRVVIDNHAQERCRSDKLSRLCSDKLIHPGSALGRGFLFPSSGRGGRVLAEGRSDAKENPRLTCSTLTCRLGKTGTYLSALAS